MSQGHVQNDDPAKLFKQAHEGVLHPQQFKGYKTIDTIEPPRKESHGATAIKDK